MQTPQGDIESRKRNRTLCDVQYFSLDYDEAPRRHRLPTQTLGKAKVVSSYTDRSMHAPALDIDRSTELVHGESGPEIWIDVPTSRRRMRHVYHLLAEYGLLAGDVPTTRELRRSARKSAWEESRHRAVDLGAEQDTLEQLGPEIEGGFEAAYLVAAEVVGERKERTGAEMRSPWRLALSCPVLLLCSSTPGHHHLYLEVEMVWSRYQTLLHALRDARIVERRWVRMSDRDQETSLRLPWIQKEAVGNLRNWG